MDHLTGMLDRMAARPLARVDAGRAALLCIDMQCDELDDGGFLGGTLGFDVGRYREVAPRVVALVRGCRALRVPVVAVQAVYDSAYLNPPMRERFAALPGADAYARKGDPGTACLPEILAAGVDLIVPKSHYSAFAPGRSFGYRPGNAGLDAYMRRPASDDPTIAARGGRTMTDYFAAARTPPRDPDAHLDGGGVVALDDYLRGKGVDTVIIAGGSTHVCVDAAVGGAFERGYRVVMPVDAIAAEAIPGEALLRHEVYLTNHGLFKADLATVATLLATLC